MYLDVLREGIPKSGENKGFRVKDNQVYTYFQYGTDLHTFILSAKYWTMGFEPLI